MLRLHEQFLQVELLTGAERPDDVALVVKTLDENERRQRRLALFERVQLMPWKNLLDRHTRLFVHRPRLSEQGGRNGASTRSSRHLLAVSRPADVPAEDEENREGEAEDTGAQPGVALLQPASDGGIGP